MEQFSPWRDIGGKLLSDLKVPVQGPAEGAHSPKSKSRCEQSFIAQVGGGLAVD